MTSRLRLRSKLRSILNWNLRLTFRHRLMYQNIISSSQTSQINNLPNIFDWSITPQKINTKNRKKTWSKFPKTTPKFPKNSPPSAEYLSHVIHIFPRFTRRMCIIIPLSSSLKTRRSAATSIRYGWGINRTCICLYSSWAGYESTNVTVVPRLNNTITPPLFSKLCVVSGLQGKRRETIKMSLETQKKKGVCKMLRELQYYPDRLVCMEVAKSLFTSRYQNPLFHLSISPLSYRWIHSRSSLASVLQHSTQPTASSSLTSFGFGPFNSFRFNQRTEIHYYLTISWANELTEMKRALRFFLPLLSYLLFSHFILILWDSTRYPC